MGQLYLALTGTPGLEKLVRHQAGAPRHRRARELAPVPRRGDGRAATRAREPGQRCSTPACTTARSSWRWSTSTARDLHAVWNRCAEQAGPLPRRHLRLHRQGAVPRALAYAHAFEDLKLVHRDVSPANVLLSFSGEVKLTDFGLAMSVAQDRADRARDRLRQALLPLARAGAPRAARRPRRHLRGRDPALGAARPGASSSRSPAPGRASAEPPTPCAARARNPEVVPPSTISGRVPPALDRIVMRALAVGARGPLPERRARCAPIWRRSWPRRRPRPTPIAWPISCARSSPTTPRDEKRRARSADRRLAARCSRAGHGAARRRGPAASALGVARRAEPPSPEGEDPRIGTTLGGRYHVRRLCGEGAMGRVYEAHHIDIGRRVAIKVLHASFHHSADLVERFRREARAASKIGHANIVDVTDSGTTPDGAFYFVMEFLDGVEPGGADRRQTGPLPVERALLDRRRRSRARSRPRTPPTSSTAISSRPTSCWSTARTRTDFVKVLDFGISKDLDWRVGRRGAHPPRRRDRHARLHGARAGGRQGRRRAHRRLRRRRAALRDADRPRRPARATTRWRCCSARRARTRGPIGELRPELPRDVQKLVMRALARTPSDRHPSMAALKEQVVACLMTAEGAPSPARMPSGSWRRRGSRWGPPTRSSRRRPRFRFPSAASGCAVRPWWLGCCSRRSRWSRCVSCESRQDPCSRPPRPSRWVTRRRPSRRPTSATPSEPSLPTPQTLPTSLAPAVVAAAPPRAAVEVAPQKVLAASSRHLVTADLAPAVAPTPAAHPTAPPPEPSSGEAHTTKAAPSASPLPRATLADTTAILTRGQTAFDRGDYQEAIRQGRQAIAGGRRDQRPPARR